MADSLYINFYNLQKLHCIIELTWLGSGLRDAVLRPGVTEVSGRAVMTGLIPAADESEGWRVEVGRGKEAKAV